MRASERGTGTAGGGRGFDDLLSPADVDELLATRGLRTPFFTLVKDGAGLPRDAARTLARRQLLGHAGLAETPSVT